MYYSSIGIIALLIHFIINYDVLKIKTGEELPAQRIYRGFLIAVMAFYFIDAFWGALYSLRMATIGFIETEFYFVIMAVSVFLWTRYVVAYLNDNSVFCKTLYFAGWIFLIFEISVLIINIFWPIAFWFDLDGTYHTNTARYINLYIQLGMFFWAALYMFFAMVKYHGQIKFRNLAIGFCSLAMSIFVFLQALYPLMPFYSLGLLIGTCALHTFVIEDEKEERRKMMAELLAREQKQEVELGTARHMAYTDPLTGIKNKSAYIEDIGLLEQRRAENQLRDFGIIVFDLNGLKIINDTRGHEAGDEYIKSASKLICKTFMHSPVYRIGGDEFVAFLEGEDFSEHEVLIKAFNKQIEKNQESGDVVISCGFACFNPKNDSSILRTFERADQKMYNRKRILKSLLAKN